MTFIRSLEELRIIAFYSPNVVDLDPVVFDFDCTLDNFSNIWVPLQ